MNNKLFIGGLSWNTDNNSLQAAFSKYGEVTECKVITDKFTGKSKGFGFVAYESGDSAQRAMDEMNGQMLDGRSIKIDFAKEKDPNDRPPRREGGGGNFRGGPSSGGSRGGFGGGNGGGSRNFR